ncbi:hypothetical protein M2135_000467 [Parabacteroides sp. PF5-9]|nr:hypothetical protein [Parabacteroides sp. PF5-9]
MNYHKPQSHSGFIVMRRLTIEFKQSHSIGLVLNRISYAYIMSQRSLSGSIVSHFDFTMPKYIYIYHDKYDSIPIFFQFLCLFSSCFSI